MTLAGVFPPIGGEVLIAWLEAVGGVVRPKRKPGDPLPMRVVTRIGGPMTDITDQGLYSLHDFAATYTAAEDAAAVTLRRVLLLGRPAQKSVTLDSGRVVWFDKLVVAEGPHWEFYSDTIERFVTTVRVDLRFSAA